MRHETRAPPHKPHAVPDQDVHIRKPQQKLHVSCQGGIIRSNHMPHLGQGIGAEGLTFVIVSV